MTHRVRLLLVVALVLALTPVAGLSQARPAPAPPGTGPFTVQMFIGGTQYAYLSVYPPATYTDGTPIPAGTPVQVKVYRWIRGGSGWTAVTLPSGDGPWGSGGKGVVGQAFINMVAVTPVDCAPPRVVVLGVTAEVNGVESPVINTANLTFRYAAEPPADNPSQCIPILVRYASPAAALAPDQVPPTNSPPPGAAAATPVPTSSPVPTLAPPTPTPTPPPMVAPTGPPRIDRVKSIVGSLTGAEEAVPGALRNMIVSVYGENFDPINPAENSVTFDGVEAQILGVVSNEIRVLVPAGAGSGPVQVTVGDEVSNSVDFTVTTTYANAVIAEDVRFGREYLPDLLQAALGAPDHDGPAGVGTPGTNIGIGIAGSITLDLGEGQEVYDGPGNDLVVYERGGGDDQSLANEGYAVFVSDDAATGFVSVGSAYGVDRGVGDGFDLASAGVDRARYVRIVDDGDDTTVNGADIDAVEVISVAPPAAKPAAAGALDLVFVIDLTDSMSDDIANVKATAVEILDTLAAEFPDHRVAILGYRDWGDEPMFEDYAFTDEQTTIVSNINRLSVSGGGDWPEAVLEALLRAIDCSSLGGWRDGVSKQIVLMGDAPPHDPIEQGADTGKTADDVEVAAKRADPVVINTIVVRSDSDTKAAFEALAAGSGGASTLAERAEDVPAAILGTIGEIAGTPVEAAEPAAAVSVEVEKNDTFGSANPIAVGSAVTGAIDPVRDADWYELVMPGGGELSIAVTDVDAALDIVFRVWNGNGDLVLDWQAPTAAGGDVSGYVDVLTGGRYLIEVRDSYDNAASASPYRLTTEFTPMVDTAEPNGSIGSATPITPGYPVQGNILPVRDRDFYSFESPGRAELHVLISDVAPELEMVFRVLNVEGDLVVDWQAGLRAGADTEAVVDLPAAGKYYLELADSRDDMRSTQPYTLTATLTPVVDAGEHNDSFGRADAMTVGEPVQGTILPVRDRDWYSIAIPGRSELHVLITNVAAELDIVFRVWNADKQVILDWQAPLRAGGDTEAYVDFGAAGTYYLEVADSRDDQRATQPYFLQTELVLAPDSLERNDSFGQAQNIQANQMVLGSILPIGDRDWYSLLVSSQGELDVSITDVPATMELVFRVWNADKKVVLDWQAPLRAGGDTSGTAAIESPGLYYLEVASSRDGARSPLPYHLVATISVK